MDIVNFPAIIANHGLMDPAQVDIDNDLLLVGLKVNDKRDGSQYQERAMPIKAFAAAAAASSSLVAKLDKISLNNAGSFVIPWETGKSAAVCSNYRAVMELALPNQVYTAGTVGDTGAFTALNFIGFPAVPTDIVITEGTTVLFTMPQVSFANISDFIDAIIYYLSLSGTGYAGVNASPVLNLAAPDNTGATYNGKVIGVFAGGISGLSYLGVGLTLHGGVTGTSPVIQLKLQNRFYYITAGSKNNIDVSSLAYQFIKLAGPLLSVSGQGITGSELGQNWILNIPAPLLASYKVNIYIFGDTL